MYQQPHSMNSGSAYPSTMPQQAQQQQQPPPPPSAFGGMTQSQYGGSQYPQYPPPPSQQSQQQPYASMYSGAGPQPPPPAMTNQQSFGPGTNNEQGPPMSGYTPPSIPNPAVSTYTGAGGAGGAGGPPPTDAGTAGRPSRPSRAQTSASQKNRSSDRGGKNYGHLVNEDQNKYVACNGDAWSACCTQNLLGCAVCCNGWLRLCGTGVRLSDIFKTK